MAWRDNPPQSSSFTLTATGYSTTPTATMYYTKIGNTVSVTMGASISATSNATTKTLTGVPAAIRPANLKTFPVLVSDNGGSEVWGSGRLATDGVITVYPTATPGSNWTSSGTASITKITFAYDLGG